jgi:hypothetical protein
MVKEPAVIMFLHVRVDSGPGLKGRFRVFLGSKDHIFKEGEGDGMGEKRIREYRDIRVVILALVIVGSPGEEISFIIFARFVNKFVVAFSKSGNVARDVAINLVWLLVVLQVRMVRENKNFVFGSHKKMVLVFQAMNNGKQFVIMDVIAMLSFVQGFGVVGHWALLASLVMLV